MARPLLTLLPLLLLAVVAACGSDDGTGPETTGTGTPPGETTASPATTQPPVTSAAPETTGAPGTTRPVDSSATPETAPEIITEALDGAVLLMGLGEERLLQLDSVWAWDTPLLDRPGVELTQVDYMLDPGYFEWIVTAIEPGTVNLVATGSSNCDDPAQCPPTEVAMTFEIDG